MGVLGKIIGSRGGDQAAVSRPIRVMVVDDSITIRTILARLIDGQADMEVVAKASSAEVALYELDRKPADVVLLDLEMPGMGGMGALPKILQLHKSTQVLVVSSLAEEGAEQTLTALSMGAADTMQKPKAGEFGPEYCAALFAKIRAVGTRQTNLAQNGDANRSPILRKAPAPREMDLLAIGASTGGIHAMCSLLRELPSRFAQPILITQHLPASFMNVLARQLAVAASREAFIAQDGMEFRGEQIFLAPGDGHLNVVRTADGYQARITHQTMPSGCTPSVDPMLESMAKATNGSAMAVILSGMGKDGVLGAQSLVEAGGTVLAQDQASASVWGMPGAIVHAGLAATIEPPEQLAATIAMKMAVASWT